MKKLDSRTLIHLALTLGGLAIILGLTLSLIVEQLAPQWPPDFTSARIQVLLIVLGSLMNQVGVWRLADRLLPNRRIYLELREETENFIQLVRELNQSKLAGDEIQVQGMIQRMHDQIERLEAAAGKEAEDIGATVPSSVPSSSEEPAAASNP